MTMPLQFSTAFITAALVLVVGNSPLLAQFEAIKIETGDTPRLRFEQTGGTPYIWDILANDLSYTIRDVTAGRDRFVFNSGAVAKFYVTNSGGTGIGTSAFDGEALCILKPAASGAEVIARFEVSDGSGTLNIANATTTDGLFIPKIQGTQQTANAALIMEGLITTDSGPNPALVYNASLAAGGALVTRPLVVYRNNNSAKVTISANGNVLATSYSPVSSRTLKRDIVALETASAAAAVRQLNPVEFVYNDDATSQNRIGFIAEDVPAIVASADRMSVPLMDTVAVVTRVVKDQQTAVESQSAAIRRQQTAIKSQTDADRDLGQRLDVAEKTANQETDAIREQAKSIENLRQRLESLERKFRTKD